MPGSRIAVTHKTPAQVPTGGVDLSATAYGKWWQGTVSDVGKAALKLANDDPLLAAITYGDFVRFDLDGTPDFLMLVEGLNTVIESPREDVDEDTTITGRSSVAMWERGAIMPPNGIDGQPWTETRVFDWGAPELDISGWGSAVELFQIGQGSEGVPPAGFPFSWLGKPLGWPDPTGYWCWSEALDSTPAAPAGTSYFARDVNVPTAGYHSVYTAADDYHRCKIDGVTISQYLDGGEGFTQTLRADVYLSAGTHRVAMEVENIGGLAGFAFSLWSQDANRDDDTLILRADTTWKALGYPATPPAFTVGKVIWTIKEETPALASWDRSFTDTHDSDGAPWPTDRQYSFRVNSDPLAMLRQLGNTDIDFVPDPADLILHAYNIGTMGVASGAATATIDRVGYLEFEGRA